MLCALTGLFMGIKSGHVDLPLLLYYVASFVIGWGHWSILMSLAFVSITTLTFVINRGRVYAILVLLQLVVIWLSWLTFNEWDFSIRAFGPIVLAFCCFTIYLLPSLFRAIFYRRAQ